jgi:hypothetical protein
MARMTDEELIDLLGKQLPDLLERRPDLEPMAYTAFLMESGFRDLQRSVDRLLYTQATGIAPARVVLATASIHSQRAQSLRQMGIEVIEPEEESYAEE